MKLPRLLALALLVVGLALAGPGLVPGADTSLEAPPALGPGTGSGSARAVSGAELSDSEPLRADEARGPARATVARAESVRLVRLRVEH